MKSETIQKIAKALRGVRQRPPDNKPKGMPQAPLNQNTSVDGQYGEEDLTDPGIQKAVTGSGDGPIIGIG